MHVSVTTALSAFDHGASFKRYSNYRNSLEVAPTALATFQLTMHANGGLEVACWT